MLKELVIKQRDIKDCGPCCLLSIVKYYNGYVPIEKIRIDAYTNKDGTNAYNLINAANSYGFDGMGVKTTLDKIDTKNIPCIAHIVLKNGLSHFVVIYKINKNNVIVMDPSYGIKKIAKKDFETVFDGIIIILKPRQEILIFPKSKSILTLIIDVIKKEKYLFLKIIICSVFITILSILLSYQVKFLSYFNNYKVLKKISLIFMLLIIIKNIYNYKRNKYEIILNKNIDINLKMPFLEHVFKLPSKYISTRTTGEIMSRVEEIDNIKMLFTDIIISIFLDTILALSTCIFLYNINSKLFLLLCIFIIVYIAISIIYSPHVYRKIMENINIETEYNSDLYEYINNFDSIKNLNITSYIIKKAYKKLIHFQIHTSTLNKNINIYKTIQDYLYDICIVSVINIGFILMYKNQLTLIDLITFNSLILYFFNPIKNISNIIPKYNYIKASYDKISEFNNIEEEKTEESNISIDGNINIQNLTFSYNNNINCINNVSINIKDKEKIYIEGKSGCGKSTICKLLMRYYDNYKGNIEIGGVNIKDYNVIDIRNNITYVSQNEKLFKGTIKENICLDKDINITELNEILELTEVNTILENKPLRLETLLQDNGFNLSGGERQRIILARSIIQEKNIIILDEALNQTDEELEVRIIKRLLEKYNNKTIIYISHRKVGHLFQKKIYL